MSSVVKLIVFKGDNAVGARDVTTLLNTWQAECVREHIDIVVSLKSVRI